MKEDGSWCQWLQPGRRKGKVLWNKKGDRKRMRKEETGRMGMRKGNY